MINTINRVRKTCLWLIIFFGVIFTGFFTVSAVAESGSWGQFVADIRQSVEESERGCQ